MGFFGAAHGWQGAGERGGGVWGGGGREGPTSLKFVTHPAMKKLGTVIPYLLRIQKIHESCDTSLEFC